MFAFKQQRMMQIKLSILFNLQLEKKIDPANSEEEKEFGAKQYPLCHYSDIIVLQKCRKASPIHPIHYLTL